MQAIAYEGYFNNGKFYAEGKAVHVPEKKRVVITVFDDIQPSSLKKAQKKEILLRLYGSCPDPTMVEPSEVPLEHEILRRYDLI